MRPRNLWPSNYKALRATTTPAERLAALTEVVDELVYQREAAARPSCMAFCPATQGAGSATTSSRPPSPAPTSPLTETEDHVLNYY